MHSLEIKGGAPLHGAVQISGGKNAALPIMAATLLTREPWLIRRVPDLSDVKFMAKILTSLGAKVALGKNEVTVQAAQSHGAIIPPAAFGGQGPSGQKRNCGNLRGLAE